MIGDSQNDVLTANNAGMFSIGVNYGFSPESLQIHPPDALIDHPEELLELLEIGRGAARDGLLTLRRPKRRFSASFKFPNLHSGRMLKTSVSFSIFFLTESPR